jgi:hypothetical protein
MPALTTVLISYVANGTSRIASVYGNGYKYESSSDSWSGTGVGSLPFTVGTEGRRYRANGSISELLYYNNPLSTDNIKKVQGYLAAKWGISKYLPTTHPFYNSVYDPVSGTPMSAAEAAAAAAAAAAKVASAATYNTASAATYNTASGNSYNTASGNLYNTASGNSYNTASGNVYLRASAATYNAASAASFQAASAATFQRASAATFQAASGATFQAASGATFQAASGAKFISDSGAKFISDSGAKFLGDSRAQFEGESKATFQAASGAKFISDSGAKFVGDSGAQFLGDSRAQFEGESKASFQSVSGPQFISDSKAQFVGDSRAQFLGDSRAQFEGESKASFQAASGAKFVNDSKAQFVEDSRAKFVGDSRAQFVGESKAKFVGESSAQFVNDSKAQFVGDSRAKFVGDSGAQFVGDSRAQFLGDSSARYIGESAATVSGAMVFEAVGNDPTNGRFVTPSSTPNSAVQDQTIVMSAFGYKAGYRTRYIIIRAPSYLGDGIMNLSQIIVYDNTFGSLVKNNIAVKKPVFATSNQSTAPILTDGTMTVRGSPNVWQSENPDPASEYLEIDLGSLQYVYGIRLLGRSDCDPSNPDCPDRMRNIRIEMSTKPSSLASPFFITAAATLASSGATASKAEFLGASTAVFQGASAAQGLSDSRAQFLGDSGAQFVGDSRANFQRDSGSQFVSDSKAQFVGDSRAKFVGESSAQFVQDSSAQGIRDSRAQFIGDSRAQLIQDSRAQLIQDSSAQFVQDSSAQGIRDSRSQFIRDSGAQLIQDSGAQFVEDSRAQFVEDSRAQNLGDSRARYLGDSGATASGAMVFEAIGNDPTNGRFITPSSPSNTAIQDQTLAMSAFGYKAGYMTRYIIIRAPSYLGDGTLNLSQIIIYDNTFSSLVKNNIAVKKPVFATSNQSTAPILTDGTMTVRRSPNVWQSATPNPTLEYLEIDLGSLQYVHAIRLLGRSDCDRSNPDCPDRMRNIRIEMNTTPSSLAIPFFIAAAATLASSGATASTAKFLGASTAVFQRASAAQGLSDSRANFQGVSSATYQGASAAQFQGDSGAQFQADSGSQYEADSGAQGLQDSAAQNMSDSRAQFQADSGASFQEASGSTYLTASGTSFKNVSGASFQGASAAQVMRASAAQNMRDSRAQFLGDSRATFQRASSAKFLGASSAKFQGASAAQNMKDSRAQFLGDSRAVFEDASAAQALLDSGAQNVRDSAAQFIGDSRAVFEGASSSQMLGDSRAQFLGDSGADYITSSSASASGAAVFSNLGSNPQKGHFIIPTRAGTITKVGGTQIGGGNSKASARSKMPDDLTVLTNGYSGRYVRIRPPFYSGDGFMALSQIIVYDIIGLNVAENANIYATSSIDGTGPAKTAIDGNLTIRDVPNVWHSATPNREKEYIELDLGSTINIFAIRVLGVNTCPFGNPNCHERLDNMRVEIKADGDPDIEQDALDAYETQVLDAQAAIAHAFIVKSLDKAPTVPTVKITQQVQPELGNDPENGCFTLPTTDSDQTVNVNQYLGRYVRLRPSLTNGDGFINLSQVIVYDALGQNISKGKQTYATSSISGTKPSSIVVDGTTEVRSVPDIWHSNSRNRDTEFFEIDLGSSQTAFAVRIIGRKGCPIPNMCENRMLGLRLEIKDTTTVEAMAAYQSSPEKVVDLSGDEQTQQVNVQTQKVNVKSVSTNSSSIKLTPTSLLGLPFVKTWDKATRKYEYRDKSGGEAIPRKTPFTPLVTDVQILTDPTITPPWYKYFDTIYRAYYYYDKSTGKTTWGHPYPPRMPVTGETIYADDGLPKGWYKYLDSALKTYFYYNTSGELTWDHPNPPPYPDNLEPVSGKYEPLYEMYRDPSTNGIFYYNTLTTETFWILPIGLKV